MKDEWYKIWFNSDYYISTYSHRNTEEAKNFIDCLTTTIQLKKETKILDLACGYGRHSYILSDMGYNVYSVDLSKNLLKKASEHLNNLICCDMRTLPLKQKFDVVLNLFTSFGYFESDEENISVVNNVYNIVKPNGIFIFDYFNSVFLKKQLNSTLYKNCDNSVKSIENERIIKYIQVDNKNFTESVKIFSPNMIYEFIKNTGFELQKTFGNYDCSDFDIDTSPRLIIVAKK